MAVSKKPTTPTPAKGLVEVTTLADAKPVFIKTTNDGAAVALGYVVIERGDERAYVDAKSVPELEA